jgi:hypothetical protein
MLIQFLRETILPDGRKVRPGEVLNLPDELAAPYLRVGQARERAKLALETTDWTETPGGIPRPPKTSPVIESPTMGPGDTVLSWQNEDNFITNQVTIGQPDASWFPWCPPPDPVSDIVIPLTSTLAGRDPVLSIEDIKAYLRIDADYTFEDCDLQRMERSARASCENGLRRVGQINADCGENIKQALLWGIEILYEHRDPTSLPEGFSLEDMFRKWLPGEVDYPTGIYS